MAGRVSFGGREVDVQSVVDELAAQLTAAREEIDEMRAREVNLVNDPNETVAKFVDAIHEHTPSPKPNYELVSAIQSFSGDKPLEIELFFDNVECTSELSKWDDAEKLRVAKLKLTGVALQYVRTDVVCREAGTYAEFKKALLSRFSDKLPVHYYAQQLSMAKQEKGETIETFADRIRKLNEKTIKVSANAEVNAALREEAERRALDVFVRGLSGRVGENTRLRFPVTLREAITIATAIQNLSAGVEPKDTDRKVFSSKPPPLCYACNKAGHFARDCRSTRRPTTAPRSGPSKSNQPTGGTQPRRMECYECRRPGHVAANCWRRRGRDDQQQRGPPTRQQPLNNNGASRVAAGSPKKQ